MSATDPYATAKANLRDTVKWLATTLAGLGGLVLAGTPFTGFGSMTPSGSRFYTACVALGLGLLLILWIWQTLIFLLRSDAVFPAQLRDDWREGTDRIETEEIQRLRAHLAAHAVDLFPRDLTAPTFTALENYANQLFYTAQAAAALPGGNAAQLAEWTRYNDAAELVLNYAGFERLHDRIERARLSLVLRGAVAAVLLLIFVWAANPPKPDGGGGSGGSNVTVLTPFVMPEKGALPPLPPVLFALGKDTLDAAALQAIGAARDFLRTHPDTGILLFAHTDTLGPEPFNRDLASRRGARVRDTLTATGGLAASRVFVAALPKADLPRITPAQTAESVNRSVELLVVSLPAR